MEELKTTDVVQLNSGGPEMSIIRFIGVEGSNFDVQTADELLKMQGFNDGDVICQWFDGNKLSSGTFKRETLKIVTE